MGGRWKLALAAAAMLAAGPAVAGWRDDLGVFRIGVVAEPGAGQSVRGLSRIREAYSGVLAMPVEVFVARDLASLVEAQAAGRIEYAVYPSMAYALAERLCGCVEPLAAPLGTSGATGIRAVLIGRRGKADSLAGLVGVRVAAVSAGRGAAELLARAGLAAEGIDLAAHRAVTVEAAGAAEAERRFLDGEADALIGWEEAGAPGGAANGSAARLAEAGIAADDLVVLWRSEPLRYGPHTLRADLDPEVRRLLLPFLTGLRDVLPDVYDLVESRHGGGYAAVGPADYASALALVDHLAGSAER